MKKNFWHVMRPIILLSVSFPTLVKVAEARTYDSQPFIEPFLHGTYGQLKTTVNSPTLGVNTVTSESMMVTGGGLRLGLENEGLFAAIELDTNYWSSLDTNNFLTSFGITAGATLTYVPIRLWFGVDPLYLSTIPGLDSSPVGAKIGVTYFLTTNLSAGLIFNHIQSKDSNGNSGSLNSAGLVFTLPLNIETPKERWKDRYQKRNESYKEENSSSSTDSSSGSLTSPLEPTPPPSSTTPTSSDTAAPLASETKAPSTEPSADEPPTPDLAPPELPLIDIPPSPPTSSDESTSEPTPSPSPAPSASPAPNGDELDTTPVTAEEAGIDMVPSP